MNEWDVITHMGRLPDKIILNGGGMKSKSWKCSKCETVHESEVKIRPPSPCKCGSIFFEKLSTPAPKEDNDEASEIKRRD
ncbi:hypothetical protein [Paenibacillus sp. FSL L8-0708]|uniref:hypothetical protein n=1 Tax=Paenibacillus sp. FSL L8-0708 TaxID=2975311 RepID=UPI0030F7F43F